ncbi:MAG: PIN domain-containing protein [Patescibacteria group bacterium]
MNGPSVRIIDANIIIRFLLRDDPILSKRAKSLFTDAEDGKFFCYLDEVTVAEVIWVLTSVYKTNRDTVAHMIEALLVHDWVVNSRKNTIFRALSFYRMSTLNYVDCWLLAVSEEKHITLETFDMKLAKSMKKRSRS